MVDHFEENGEGECIPWEVDYTTGAKGDVDGIVADCAARNMGNNCATRSCMLEHYQNPVRARKMRIIF